MKYKYGVLTKLEEGVRRGEYILSCACGTVRLNGDSAKRVACECCGNEKFKHISDFKTELIPYIELLSKNRKGFKVKRTNLSVKLTEGYNVFLKPNMIQVLKYDMPTKTLKLYKNGKDSTTYSNIVRFFNKVEHNEFYKMIMCEENEKLFKFMWERLCYSDSGRGYDKRIYYGLPELLNLNYIQILNNAGFGNLDRFYKKHYSNWGGNIENKDGKNPQQILGVPKFMLNYIRENESIRLSEIDMIKKALKKIDANRFKELIEIVRDEGSISQIYNCLDTIVELADKYKYKNLKKLTLYLFREIKMHQGIDDPSHGARLLRDYVNMATILNYDYEKYPKSLKKDHDVMQMNYNVQESEMKNRQFKIQTDSESYKEREFKKKDKEFAIVSPKEISDLVKEGSELSHCVASYVNAIISGQCQIYFLREKENIDKPLATIEVRNGTIRQARGFANRVLNAKEKEFLKDWSEKKELVTNHYY